MDSLSTPVVFSVFNRPATTSRVFARIRELRPSKLLIVADGPRPDRPGEAELCAEVRRIVTSIDWPCELLTNFSETNLGCHPRIVSGYDWAFSLVEEAILLEDDTLPDPSFFHFCSELLEKYRDDFRIASITGTNYVHRGRPVVPDSYTFSLLGSLWGWATWRSRWESYDRSLENWQVLRARGAVLQILGDRRAARWWTRIFDQCYERGERAAWDYRWTYTNLFQHRFSVVPRINLVENIGFGEAATHTKSVDKRLVAKVGCVDLPCRHPPALIWDRSFDKAFQRKKYPPLNRYIDKLKQIVTLRYFKRDR